MRDRRYKKLTVRAFAVGTGLSVIVGTFAAPLTTMAAAAKQAMKAVRAAKLAKQICLTTPYNVKR